MVTRSVDQKNKMGRTIIPSFVSFVETKLSMLNQTLSIGTQLYVAVGTRMMRKVNDQSFYFIFSVFDSSLACFNEFLG